MVEALLPGGGSGVEGEAGKPPPKHEAGAKEWLETNLKPWLCYYRNEVQKLPRHWVVSLEQFSTKLGVYLVGYRKIYGLMGRRYWRVALYLLSYQEIRIILL